MKVKAECPHCGATNTEKNLIAYGDDSHRPLGPFVFKCWKCLKGFSMYNDKSKILPEWADPFFDDDFNV